MTSSFLPDPAPTPDVQALYDDDVDQVGYVMNTTRLWAHQPALSAGLSDLIRGAGGAAGLTFRERGILVAATASTLRDSYCALAWGSRLGKEAEPDLAAAVISGTDEGLTPRERALASWARAVAGDPNATTASDVQALRDAGLDDQQVVAVTAYVALRIAFSTVNDALGAAPDGDLRNTTPAPVLAAVTFGRPIADG